MIGLSLYFESWIPVITLIALIIIGVVFGIYITKKRYGDINIFIFSKEDENFISEEQFRRIKESEHDETFH